MNPNCTKFVPNQRKFKTKQNCALRKKTVKDRVYVVPSFCVLQGLLRNDHNSGEQRPGDCSHALGGSPAPAPTLRCLRSTGTIGKWYGAPATTAAGDYRFSCRRRWQCGQHRHNFCRCHLPSHTVDGLTSDRHRHSCTMVTAGDDVNSQLLSAEKFILLQWIRSWYMFMA